MKPFRIYTQPGCPFCELALSLLKTVAKEDVEHIVIGDDPIIKAGLTAITGTAQWPATLVNVSGQEPKLIIGQELRALSDAITNFLNIPRG